MLEGLPPPRVHFSSVQSLKYCIFAKGLKLPIYPFQAETKIPRDKLQLVGVTSMFIASKYEEMYCPEISDFSYITDNAYSKADIRKMEILILKKLDFNVSYPLPLHFLRRNSKAGSVSF